ncbi:organic solute transporter Ostalpha-domain-containing protein [Phlebopus sp. FC_14]|nr:organic solute transporter Ostalpha-domain-containing protein [Phlebopus sp. FC_14]
MAPTCPSSNSQYVDQSSFWSSGDLDWDAHRIGWAIAGGCAAVTVLISLVSVLQHCRNYNKPNEQRQILRILYMPPVYAVISFFSYRFFRSYTYYSLAESAYEAVTLSAFLLLLIEYVADTASGHNALKAIERKDKRPLPIPFCCWRYRPTKAYFMYTVKWSVLQYVIIRPACSIAGIICEAFNVLCDSGPYSVDFASVYLEAIDFVSISIALYGLFLFYGLTKDELVGRRPLAKFLSIKLIVMFTFYQSFVFSALEGNVIKATQYWTETNIADGLNALTICIEMVFFSLLMMWAYTANEYKIEGAPKTGIGRPLWDSINYTDFAIEIFGSLKFFFRGSASTRDNTVVNSNKRMDFGQAFGVGGRSYTRPPKEGTGAPYPYGDPEHADSDRDR